jgi:hypothetical protein
MHLKANVLIFHSIFNICPKKRFLKKFQVCSFSILLLEHDIKHYGTFGSPKIAKHVYFGPKEMWERVCERGWDTGNIRGNVHGILSGNMGALSCREGSALGKHWASGCN